jgi:hypothetical protein
MVSHDQVSHKRQRFNILLTVDVRLVVHQDRAAVAPNKFQNVADQAFVLLALPDITGVFCR